MTLVEQIKAHALDHYNEGAWSALVECYTNDELTKLVDDYGVSTLKQFAAKYAPINAVWEDRKADAENSTF